MKKRFLKMFSLVLAVSVIGAVLTFGASATSEFEYDDGSYYRIEDFYVTRDPSGQVYVGYLEGMFVTASVVGGVNCVQLGSEVRGGSTADYVTTSITKIESHSPYTQAGKVERVELSSTTEGSRLLNAAVQFNSPEAYVEDGVIGSVTAECTGTTATAWGREYFDRRWDGREWKPWSAN